MNLAILTNLKSMSEVVIPEDIDPDFPFWVVEEEDGSLTINWDETHPVTSVFNTWTESDFIEMLCNKAKEVIDSIEALNEA